MPTASVTATLIDVQATHIQGRTLSATNCSGIPIATWQEPAAILLNRMNQYEVASTIKTSYKHSTTT